MLASGRGENSSEYGLPPCMEERLKSFPMETYGTEREVSLREAGLGAIYIAHAKHLAHRRTQGEGELDKVGLRGSFLTGYDAEELSDEDISCLYPSNAAFDRLSRDRDMSANWFHTGELSLSFKHVAAAYQAVIHGYNHTLVLEDDFTFSGNFVAGVAKLLRDPEGWLKQGGRYDILYIGSYGHSTAVDLQRPPRTYLETLNQGTVGYIISQQGARHLLAHMPITGPSDHMLGNDLLPSALPKRWLHRPFLVVPHDDFGTTRGLATPKASHYIRTPDILPCVGRKCPCTAPTNVSRWLIRGGCCCHASAVP